MTLSKISLAVALSGVMVLTACETMTDPNNPNRNAQSQAAIGAGIGAVAGLLLGDTAQERRNGALVGAAIGAGIGGVNGAALDRQEAELRQQLGSNARIVNTGSQLVVTLPQDILFATGVFHQQLPKYDGECHWPRRQHRRCRVQPRPVCAPCSVRIISVDLVWCITEPNPVHWSR
jgi:uncharacterized membrane protein